MQAAQMDLLARALQTAHLVVLRFPEAQSRPEHVGTEMHLMC